MTDLTPYDLACEQVATPLGIDETRPRLSWRLRSPARGDRPTAHRIRVAAHPADLASGERLVWDTGRVPAGGSPYVVYDGAPLVSSTRYHWAVEVWDAAGEHAGTAASWFETGLLHPGEWTAAWIGRDPYAGGVMDPPRDEEREPRTGHLEPPAQLRRAFDVAGTPVRARLYASARGLYELRVNGRRAGDHELAPGWTEYHERVLYQAYDVTELLRSGENVLGAVLADGWWSGFVGFDERRPAKHYGDDPQLIAQLAIDFADGSRRIIATDGSWREHPGAIRYADLLLGEHQDARQAVPGWDLPGFDDSGWRPVALAGTDTSVLTAMPDQPVRVVDERPAETVRADAGGGVLVDFGQNLVGRLRLTLRDVPAGTRVRIRHGEILDADGALYTENLRGATATDVYVTGGDPVEVFQPAFTVHGFRYAHITGLPAAPSTSDVTAQVLATDTPRAGEFTCSDETVTRLESNIVWGRRGNFVSIPTDCPQRDERLGWLADAQIFLPTACRTADVSAFFARWMLDVVDGQDAGGAFRDVAPLVHFRREGAPGWGDGGVIIPWHLYRTYGDVRVLERSYPAMAAWIGHIHRHNPELIWRDKVGNHYGDWLQVDAETPREVMATAYFARSTQLVALAAEALGHTDDAKRYAELHAEVRGAFIAAFVTEDGRVHGGTQTAHLLALAFGLLPEHLVDAAFAHLAADIEARGNHLTTGFIGVPLLCPVLTEHGRADLAYALLHQDTYPSWGYSIAHGATTIWERWDGWTEEHGFQAAAMNSFNHYSLGSVGEWLHGRVAGIDQEPDSVAYERLLLRPTVGGRLTWASARYESPRGEVRCGWSLDGGDLTVDVTVPPGATATVYVPTTEPGSVRLDGAAVGEVVAVESGAYRFTSRYDTP